MSLFIKDCYSSRIINLSGYFILLTTFPVLFLNCSSDYLSIAKLHIQKSEYREAKSVLEQQLKENSTTGDEGYLQNDEVYYYLGIVDCELGDYNQGLEDFSHSLYVSSNYEEKISEAGQHYYTLVFNEAAVEFEKSNYDRALELFQLSLKFKTNDHEALEYVKRLKKVISGDESDSKNKKERTVISDSSIAFFDGTGIQDTKPFKCGGEWEVEWYHDGDIFQIFLYNPDGKLIDKLANENIPGRGSTYYYKKGEYYLKVNAVGNWKINIMPVK